MTPRRPTPRPRIPRRRRPRRQKRPARRKLLPNRLPTRSSFCPVYPGSPSTDGESRNQKEYPARTSDVGIPFIFEEESRLIEWSGHIWAWQSAVHGEGLMVTTTITPLGD